MTENAFEQTIAHGCAEAAANVPPITPVKPPAPVPPEEP
jgi:hypothetical protein